MIKRMLSSSGLTIFSKIKIHQNPSVKQGAKAKARIALELILQVLL